MKVSDYIYAAIIIPILFLIGLVAFILISLYWLISRPITLALGWLDDYLLYYWKKR